MSNEYIDKNYRKQIDFIGFKEIHSTERKIWWLRRKKRYDLRKTLNFRFSQKCLKLFFPHHIRHLNQNLKYDEIEFTDWLFTHFSSFGKNINPRCLVWFFNSLFKKQYQVYAEDPKLLNLKHNINPVPNAEGMIIPIFLSEVIENTYSDIQNDELKTIYGLLKEKDQKEIFKKINFILTTKNKFNYGDISLKQHSMTKEEYNRYLKYLTILGILEYDKNNRNYNTPIIYRRIMEI